MKSSCWRFTSCGLERCVQSNGQKAFEKARPILQCTPNLLEAMLCYCKLAFVIVSKQWKTWKTLAEVNCWQLVRCQHARSQGFQGDVAIVAFICSLDLEY